MTQHYLGGESGYGPVQDSENLIYVVFESTARTKDDRRLTHEEFPTKQLVRSEVSAARITYMSRDEVDNSIVTPGTSRNGNLIGIAIVGVSGLRGLTYIPSGQHEARQRRAICVLDKVSQCDYEAHAALGYSENQADLTAKQKAIAREQIRRDVADEFGEIRPIKDAYAIARAVAAPEQPKVEAIGLNRPTEPVQPRAGDEPTG